MKVDKLKFDDLEALQKMYDESFSKISNIDLMKQKFSKISNSDTSQLLCIHIDNKLVAFLKCDIIDDFVSVGKPYMFLSNLCVEKEYRGKGLSTILLNEAEKISKDFNCEYIFLTCSNDKVCAHGVYKKMGYNIKNSNIFIKYL